MVHVVNKYNRHAYSGVIDIMLSDRKRVFVDTLRWDVPHDSQKEWDEFDDDLAEYLILQDSSTGDHLASLRLLRTDRPHLLGKVFPFLCEMEEPMGPNIREITRFCLSPRLRAPERLLARNKLVRALVEYGLLTGISTYTAVCEMSFLSQVLSIGWYCRPLGLPQVVEGSTIGALRIDLDPNTLRQFVRSWQCDTTALRIAEFDTSLAA